MKKSKTYDYVCHNCWEEIELFKLTTRRHCPFCRQATLQKKEDSLV